MDNSCIVSTIDAGVGAGVVTTMGGKVIYSEEGYSVTTAVGAVLVFAVVEVIDGLVIKGGQHSGTMPSYTLHAFDPDSNHLESSRKAFHVPMGHMTGT